MTVIIKKTLLQIHARSPLKASKRKLLDKIWDKSCNLCPFQPLRRPQQNLKDSCAMLELYLVSVFKYLKNSIISILPQLPGTLNNSSDKLTCTHIKRGQQSKLKPLRFNQISCHRIAKLKLCPSPSCTNKNFDRLWLVEKTHLRMIDHITATRISSKKMSYLARDITYQ